MFEKFGFACVQLATSIIDRMPWHVNLPNVGLSSCRRKDWDDRRHSAPSTTPSELTARRAEPLSVGVAAVRHFVNVSSLPSHQQNFDMFRTSADPGQEFPAIHGVYALFMPFDPDAVTSGCS